MAEDPSIPVLVERVANVQADVSEIKANMATSKDQANTDRQITALAEALATEKGERIAGDLAEALERKAVGARLQIVEDRMEQRKYLTMSAVAVGALGAVLGLVSTLVQTGILAR